MRNPFHTVSDPNSFTTCPGSAELLHRERRFDGVCSKVVIVGKSNIQETIDAYAPYTDLNYMLTRLSNGDRSVLSSKQPIYGDFSGLSRNPTDVINIVNNAEQEFATLEMTERSKYNNDWMVWLSEVLAGRFEKTRSSVPEGTSKKVSPDASGNVEKPQSQEKE